MGMSGVGATDGVEVQVPRVAIDINYSIELILYLDRQMLNLIWVNRVRPTYDRSSRFNLALDTTSSNVQLQRDFCMPSCFRRFKLTKGQFLNRAARCRTISRLNAAYALGSKLLRFEQAKKYFVSSGTHRIKGITVNCLNSLSVCDQIGLFWYI